MEKSENIKKVSKNEYTQQYIKDNYRQIHIRVRKDDCMLKLLDRYMHLHSDESINSIVCNALFEWLNMQLSHTENSKKIPKRTNKNKT